MKTTDIWLASFLYQKDSSKLVDFNKDNKRAYYEFNYTQEEWDKLKMEFVKSHDIVLKYTIEKLKDLVLQ